MKVAIIGAGPAGITAAYELAKAGISVEVFEASPFVGGMARTVELWGMKADLGPHRFFSKDTRVNRLWLEVVGEDYRIVKRLTRIYYKGNFFSYPLKPLNALKNLGIGEAFSCVTSYVRQKLMPIKQDGSFEDWVVGRFGRRLYEIFFQRYSEKLWGIPCKELDSDFAAQRIKKLSLFEAVKNAFLGDTSNKHKTLVDAFAYPTGGSGMVYERMAEFVRSHGGKIHLKTPVHRVILENGKAGALEFGKDTRETRPFDHIISTMPITKLISGLPDVPEKVSTAAKELKFRNTILVYLNLKSEDLFPDQWIYVQSPEFKFGRVTNFRNWVPELYGDSRSSILAMEYWCYAEDPIWSASDEALSATAIEELKLMGLKTVKALTKQEKYLVRKHFMSSEFIDDLKKQMKESSIDGASVQRLPQCYPVYRKGYKQHLKVVEGYLNTIKGLGVIGRYGAFKYNNQDHSLLMGILAAENILKGTRHDLWGVNTDYEDYQETSVITETGLIKQ